MNFLANPILCKSPTKQSRKREPWEIQALWSGPYCSVNLNPSSKAPKSHIHSHSFTLCRCKRMKAAPSNERRTHKVNMPGGTMRSPLPSHSVRGGHRNMSKTSAAAQRRRKFTLHFRFTCWAWDRGVWDRTDSGSCSLRMNC